MNEGRTVFSQLIDHLPKYEFDKCVERYEGNFHVRTLPTYEQFLIMAFAQLTWRESLRDIQTCLRALGPKLYHCGIRRAAARSTLADANEKRDWRIFADFAQVLMNQTTTLYAGEPLGVDIQAAAYALDSTMISLCLSLCPWAKFRQRATGVKLHTLLALRGNYPTVVVITRSCVHDVHILDELTYEAGSFYIMDRAYLDFQRLHRIDQCGAFFVTRARADFRGLRRYSRLVDKTSGLLFDQTVTLTTFYAKRDYPDPLRRIGLRDPLSGRRFVFLTNNFTEPALTICQLFRCRWQVELFFKWIKQHLRIKAFYGTSENAVRSQLWIATSVYLLVAIVRKRLKLGMSLYSILQILSLTLFEKTPILQALCSQPLKIKSTDIEDEPCLPGFLTGH